MPRRTFPSLLVLLLCGLLPFAAQAQLHTYPSPAQTALSPLFSVTVSQGGKTAASPVYPCNVINSNVFPRKVESAAFTQFSFGGNPVEVRVRWLGDAPIDSVRVRPLSLGVRATVEGRDIHFLLDRPANVSVEVNGDIFHNLMLFACPEETWTPAKKKTGKGLIYFGPGYHELPGDTLSVPSATTVYVAGGAVVNGHICVDDASDVRILGRGIILSGRHAGLYIRRSRRVRVDGLVLTQLPVGQSDSISISNVKAISSYSWGDGLNVFASSHVNYDHVFCRTSDDCTTVYATRKGFTGNSSHISMRHSVLWADVAHPIFIGLHGNPSRPDTIQQVLYDDIDILDEHEYQIDYQGCLAINAGDDNLVRDITFRNIRIEDIRHGQLVSLRVSFNRKYCTAPGRGIENVLFHNVSYRGCPPETSIIAGYDEERPVRNVRFKNLVINGQLICDDMPEKPKWYKTSDMARIFVGEHVENISFVRSE